MIVVGVALGVGGFVIGMPVVGVVTAAGLIFGGWLNSYLGAGWDEPLGDAAELYTYGRPANAEVLSVEDSQLSPDGTRTAKLAVRVSPVNESGFKSTRTVALPGGRVPVAGSTITVKFDPNSRKNFVLLEDNVQVKDHVTASAETLFGGLKTS
jgi:hypothetical protein